MVSLRSIVSLSVNLSIKNETVCCFSMESWIGCDISSTPNMVYDNDMKMVLNDTVPKKAYLSKNMQYCQVLEAENK